MQTGAAPLEGTSHIVEGGLTPHYTQGETDNVSIETVGASGDCGNGIDCSSSSAPETLQATQNGGGLGGDGQGTTGHSMTSPAHPTAPSTHATVAVHEHEQKTEAAAVAALPQPVVAAQNPLPQTQSRQGSAASPTPDQQTTAATLRVRPHIPVTQHDSPVSDAVALGGMSLTQGGILARLAWMARFKHVYGAVPAFLS